MRPQPHTKNSSSTSSPIPNGQPQKHALRNTIQTKQVILHHLYVYRYMHATAINEKSVHEFEKEQKNVNGRFEERIGKGEMLDYTIIKKCDF